MVIWVGGRRRSNRNTFNRGWDDVEVDSHVITVENPTRNSAGQGKLRNGRRCWGRGGKEFTVPSDVWPEGGRLMFQEFIALRVVCDERCARGTRHKKSYTYP